MFEFSGVIRSKGFFWLASTMKYNGFMSHAGNLFNFEKAGVWWAEVPEEEWPNDAIIEVQKLEFFWSMFGEICDRKSSKSCERKKAFKGRCVDLSGDKVEPKFSEF